MRVLVTGKSGFVGRHLQAYASGQNDLDLVAAPEAMDLRDAESIRRELAPLRFDHVVHLAAQSNVPLSVSDPSGTFEVNALGTVRLVQILRDRRFQGRFLYVSSGDVYGTVDESALPVTESTPRQTANPYAASKVAAEEMLLAWGRRGDLDVVIARPFNHLGAGQSTNFAIARFADALARIRRGERAAVLNTGRLDVTRDFLDVGDVVAAYHLLLLKGAGNEIYNVCSGVERRLDVVLQSLIALAGVAVELRQDDTLMRRGELVRMVGRADKLKAATGWQPIIPFESTLQSVYTYFERGCRTS